MWCVTRNTPKQSTMLVSASPASLPVHDPLVVQVHFHIVPAPLLNGSVPERSGPVNEVLDHRVMLKLEKDAREELDDDEGELIAERIRSRL